MWHAARFAHKSISAIIAMVTVFGVQPYPALAQIDKQQQSDGLAIPAQDDGVGANFIVPGPNLLTDPGFEQSYGSTTGPWSQQPPDTICINTDGNCFDTGAGYYSGGGWAWFGGLGSNSNLVSQSVTFPKCGAVLEFYLYIGRANGGNQNFFEALIDNTPVFWTDATKSSSYPVYTYVGVDVSQFADGNVHTVKFYSETPDIYQVFFNLDNVALRQVVSSSSSCVGVGVRVGGIGQTGVGLTPASGDRVSYIGLNDGPVEVDNFANFLPFVASQRVGYYNNNLGKWTSFSELMGVPFSSLGKRYYFPWYNNKTINTQLRFGSFDTDFDTTVRVTIGGVLRGTYNLTPNTGIRVSYQGLDSGPVVIESSSELIIASERVAYQNPQSKKWTSYSEMMGLPDLQLSSRYWFPWYNNLDLNSQLRFGNVGTTTTNVTVTIGGVVRGTYTLQPKASQRVAYLVNSGPILIESSGNVPLIASLRVAYTPDNGVTWPDVSEMMGLPASVVSTSYSFPWYNNLDINTQLRFANVGSAATNITVKIGGVIRGVYPLGPNQSTRQSYSLSSGPVVVESSGNVPIIASERVGYFNGTKWTSFSEMMGLPSSQLTSHYVFPWYNNVDLNTQLRFGAP